MSTSVTSAMITVVIVNDAIPELTEDFFVTLTAIRLTSGKQLSNALSFLYRLHEATRIVAPTFFIGVLEVIN